MATVGNFSLSVIKGDLTKQTTQVIVNSVTEHLDLSKGNVSRAVLATAGQAVQIECNNPGRGRVIIINA